MTISHPFAGTSHIAIARRSLSRSVAVLALLSLGHAANAQTVVPTNASPTSPACIVSSDELNGWFEFEERLQQRQGRSCRQRGLRAEFAMFLL